jgi:hypothetical protein
MVCFTSDFGHFIDEDQVRNELGMGTDDVFGIISGDWLRDNQDEVVSIGRNDDSESD